jgi:hypothetical protein
MPRTSTGHSKSLEKDLDIEDLMKQVKAKGCRVSQIEEPKAREFVERVHQDKLSGKEPNLTRSSELLEEIWGIDISREALRNHVRGKCSCKKTKKK